MQRGEIWFAATPGGDRPVLVLTRDPVADRIGSVVVAALTRTRRGLVSELPLTRADGVPTDSVVNFDVLAGDATRDGVVNLADFNILAANFGQSNRPFTEGDFNYDGTVNLLDFNILAGHFGQQVAPAGSFAKTDTDQSETAENALDELLT